MLGEKRSSGIFAETAETQMPKAPKVRHPKPAEVSDEALFLCEVRAEQERIGSSLEEIESEDIIPAISETTKAANIPGYNRSKESAVPRAHTLFFTPEDGGREFSEVLREVQEHISSNYSALLTGGNTEEVKGQIKRYINKYVQESRAAVPGMDATQLVDALYTEMAEYSFLTKYIFGTNIEEIDINAWNDIEVQYSGGRTEKLAEHFDSPDHAINVIRRMLHVSGVVLDNASPLVTGTLAKNVRQVLM